MKRPSRPAAELPGSTAAAVPPATGDAPAPAGRGPIVLPVSLLVSSARLLIERHLGLVWVSGEVSNFTRAASGHCYFDLKDAQAQVRCVFFQHKAQYAEFALKDGQQVELRATASIYEARGEFQLNVETVRLAGQGALYERYARLKARLDAAGWFAQERKRAAARPPARRRHRHLDPRRRAVRPADHAAPALAGGARDRLSDRGAGRGGRRRDRRGDRHSPTRAPRSTC